MQENSYDLIIIGGGPGGYAAAITAAKEGLSVLLFEGEHLGGTCLNVGCIPTKYLLDKAAAMEKVRRLTEDKIFKDCGLYSFQKIQKGRQQVVNRLVSGVDYLLKANKVTVIRKFARLIEAGKAECDGVVYKALNIIIATGSVPSFIPIPGAEYAITSTQALALEKVPRRLVVIGGGVIGMELASAYCSYGSQVTVIEVMQQLYPAESRQAVAYMERELRKRGIRILCGTKVSKVERDREGTKEKYIVSYEGKENGEAEADIVLMAAGRHPNLQGVCAESVGIALSAKGEIMVNEHMETNVPRIYAIGDVIGGFQLAHAAYAEGDTAVNHILGREVPADIQAMPRCIYTMPAFAAVGIDEDKAECDKRKAVVGEFSYSGNGMALAEGAEGIVRVVMDAEKKTTLGVQIVGENAPEMIALAAEAVRSGMTLDEWETMIVAHPSLSEMLREAALDCFDKSVHKAVKGGF